MINFNEVYYKSVQKEAVAWTESLSTMLFDLPRDGLADLKIPLSPAIFKRIWPESIRSKAFHLTDYDGLGKLKRLQGGKKSISAFYNMDDYIIQSGIKTHGGYVVELEGDVLAAAPDDISSQPDKTGRRWLTFSTIMNPYTAGDPGLGGRSKLKRIEKDLENLLIDILVKNDLGPYKKGLTTRELNRAWSYLGKSTGGKEKSIIIKDYIDGMEKIMKKYSKPLKSVFTDYAFDKELVPDPDSGEKAMWDEIVVNNFKIKKIHVTEEFGEDWQEDDDIEGFPFELYPNGNGDLIDYIARTRN